MLLKVELAERWGFLAAVIGLGTILGKMMEVSGTRRKNWSDSAAGGFRLMSLWCWLA
ncbi:hypothetical protein [Escherichia coli]|uniref:GntT/GntP/DsdX family permease n=1 Tax=Escherichia coli TaxID=562 RepID=UPI0021F6865D|nr:hypothetical protein [Escherichia coli]